MKKNFVTKEKPKQVTLINPLNSEVWHCKDYNNLKSIDGVNYITVFKEENINRTFLIRKDALKIYTTF